MTQTDTTAEKVAWFYRLRAFQRFDNLLAFDLLGPDGLGLLRV